MTLEQLRIFIAVAEREHMTRAAQAVNLTQSAVSGAIAALEARHGIHLFDRVGRNIVLNETGRAFLPEARAVLARASAAEAVLADLGAVRRGRLAIHASQTIAGYWLPARLVAFNAAYPAVELDVAIGNTAEVAAAVTDGTAELGLVEGELDNPLLAAMVIGSDAMVVIVPPGHGWEDAAPVHDAMLKSTRWVLREPGSGTRSSFLSALAAVGLSLGQLDVAMTLPSNEAVLAAVMAGAGATAISASVAASALAAGTVRRASFDLPARPYHLLRHKERYRSRAADAFVAVAKSLTD